MSGDEPIIDLTQVQADVFPGFRKPFQCFLLCTLPEPGRDLTRARDELRWLAHMVTSGADARKSNLVRRSVVGGDNHKFNDSLSEVWVNMGFTYDGLARLLGSAVDRLFDIESFNDPAGRLGSLMPSSPESGVNRQPHVLINVAADSRTNLSGFTDHVSAKLERANVEVEAHHGARIMSHGQFTNQEHFGFTDGVSKLGLLGRVVEASGEIHALFPRRKVLPVRYRAGQELSWEDPNPPDPKSETANVKFSEAGYPLVNPGLLFLGSEFPTQNPATAMPDEASIDEAQRRAGQAAAIAEGGVSEGDLDPSLLESGSFMVWLRLDQDVAAFRRSAQEFADAVTPFVGNDGPVSTEDAAALFVGRRQNGAPLIAKPVFPRPRYDPATKDVTYSKDTLERLPANNAYQYDLSFDVHGRSIPADPDEIDTGPACPVGAHVRKTNPRSARSFATSIFRRSIPYEGAGSSGLFFVCYQASIKHQFEEIQGQWVNGTGKPYRESPKDLFTSDDALRGRPISWMVPHPRGEGSLSVDVSTGFVRMRGGTYVFVPSVNALGEILRERSRP